MHARTAVKPLVAKIAPIAGETLLSLVARAGEANIFEPPQLIAAAGFSGDPRFIAFSGMERAQALASLLSVESEEINQRLHFPVQGQPEPTLVNWFGTGLERRFIDAKARRIAPKALAASVHHRAAWTLRVLSFCPETFQKLIARCPTCDLELGWRRTAGLDRCEHCKARLSEASSVSVPEELHANLRNVTDLISADEARRRQALERLPEPFSHWDDGEAFGAAIELGAAWFHPDANRRSMRAKRLARGDLGDHSAEILASGWQVLVGWPTSLEELVRRAGQGFEEAQAPGSLELRDISLLGRHLDLRLPRTRFRLLLQKQLGAAALAGRTPIKLRSGGKAARRDRSILTLTEAAKASGISAGVLKRLYPHGAGFAGGRAGQGGQLRFHAERVLSAARVMDDALTPAAAAARLGVPTYCVEAFVKRKLVSRIADADVDIMKGTPFTVSAKSIDALHQRFAALPTSSSPLQHRLVRLLAHRYSPATWAAIFADLLSGRAGFCFLEDLPDYSLSQSIYADREKVDACLRQVCRPRVPHRQTVTAEHAGFLLGIGLPDVLRVIGGGVLKAERTERSWMLHLADVITFDRRWVLSPELDVWLFGASGGLSRALPSEMGVKGVKGWRRQRMREIYGSSEGAVPETIVAERFKGAGLVSGERDRLGFPVLNTGRLMEYALEQIRNPGMFERIISGQGPPDTKT